MNLIKTGGEPDYLLKLDTLKLHSSVVTVGGHEHFVTIRSIKHGRDGLWKHHAHLLAAKVSHKFSVKKFIDLRTGKLTEVPWCEVAGDVSVVFAGWNAVTEDEANRFMNE
jgi:hypothetical protein